MLRNGEGLGVPGLTPFLPATPSKQMAESELTRSMSEFLSRLQDDLKEAMNTMMCSKCQGKHK